jgi:hypothetical protein
MSLSHAHNTVRFHCLSGLASINCLPGVYKVFCREWCSPSAFLKSLPSVIVCLECFFC